jgi:hypothetical protein
MVSRDVPLALQVRVYRYLERQHRQHRDSAMNDRGFMEQLSKWLQVQLIEVLNRQHICRHPFFKEIEEAGSQELIRRICLEAQPMLFTAGDPVVEEAHLALCTHFLVRGKLRVAVEGGSKYLKPPCWVGEKCLFVDTLRTNTVYAVGSTETLSVQKASVIAACIEFPEVQGLYQKYRRNILENDMDSLRCPICHDFGHTEETCPERNHEESRRGSVHGKDSQFAGLRTTGVAALNSLKSMARSSRISFHEEMVLQDEDEDSASNTIRGRFRKVLSVIKR